MPVDLPGFYFDKEANRYFPLRAPRSDYSEKRKQRKKEETKNLANLIYEKRLEAYKASILELVDSANTVTLGEANKRPKFAALKFFARNDRSLVKSINVPLDSVYGSKPVCIELVDNTACCGHYIFTDYGVLLFQPLANNNQSPNIILDLREEPSWRIVTFHTLSDKFYLHLWDELHNKHRALFISGTDLIIQKKLPFKTAGFVGDSIPIQSTIFVAVGSILRWYDWALTPGTTNCHQFSSDIVSMVSYHINEKLSILYIACRNSTIYSKLVGSTKRLGLSKYSIPILRTIISILAIDDTKLLVSGILKDASKKYNVILMVDLAIDLDAGNQVFVTAIFRSSHFNIFKGHEIFRLSPDHRFLLYGSCNTQAPGFEIFSCWFDDNYLKYDQEKIANQNNGPSTMVFYPIKVMVDYTKFEKSSLQLSTAQFTSPIDLDESIPAMQSVSVIVTKSEAKNDHLPYLLALTFQPVTQTHDAMYQPAYACITHFFNIY